MKYTYSLIQHRRQGPVIVGEISVDKPLSPAEACNSCISALTEMPIKQAVPNFIHVLKFDRNWRGDLFLQTHLGLYRVQVGSRIYLSLVKG